MVPRADVLGVGHIPRVQRGAFDRQVLVHGLSRDAAHHVHAELQAESVHRIGERAESLAVDALGKRCSSGIWRPYPSMHSGLPSE